MRADGRTRQTEEGFSLVEVATSIGVIAFALVALLGVFPLGLENSRLCVSDTRGSQVVRTISATLQGESFRGAECFGIGLPPINFAAESFGVGQTTGAGSALEVEETSQAPAELKAAADLQLFVSYDVNALPRIVRTAGDQAPADAIYRVELRGRRDYFVPLLTPTTGRVAGVHLNLRIFGVRDKKPFAESWVYLRNNSPE